MNNFFTGLPRWLQFVWALILVYLIIVLYYFWIWGWSVLPFPV